MDVPDALQPSCARHAFIQFAAGRSWHVSLSASISVMDIQTRGFPMLSVLAFIRKGARDSVVSGLLFRNQDMSNVRLQVNRSFYILHRASHIHLDFINSALGDSYSKIGTYCSNFERRFHFEYLVKGNRHRKRSGNFKSRYIHTRKITFPIWSDFKV